MIKKRGGSPKANQKVSKYVLEDIPVLLIPGGAQGVISEMLHRGYEGSYALSYAKAARSWTVKNSPERKIWKQVEETLSFSSDDK